MFHPNFVNTLLVKRSYEMTCILSLLAHNGPIVNIVYTAYTTKMHSLNKITY